MSDMKRGEFITLIGGAAAACRTIQWSGITAGHQRRKRGAVDCTPAQAVAAALLASGMGNTVTASGPRPRSRSSGNSVHC